MADKNALMIGLDPSVVNYDKWPGLTSQKLMAGLTHDLEALRAEGIGCDFCLVDHGETA
ncbi:MAG: hypothetical protein AAF619_00380 [Pseudomonadota bacterium]